MPAPSGKGAKKGAKATERGLAERQIYTRKRFLYSKKVPDTFLLPISINMRLASSRLRKFSVGQERIGQDRKTPGWQSVGRKPVGTCESSMFRNLAGCLSSRPMS